MAYSYVYSILYTAVVISAVDSGDTPPMVIQLLGLSLRIMLAVFWDL